MKKTKKVLSFVLILLAVLISGFQITFAQSSPQNTYVIMYLNNSQINVIKGEVSNTQTLEAAPYAPNGTTLVPIRAILEAYDAVLTWDKGKQQININKGSTKIVININSKTAYVDGKRVELAEPARILNDRTLIPLRFVSENIGLNVKWLGQSKKIVISNTNLSTGASVKKAEYYDENGPNSKTVKANLEIFTNYKLSNNEVKTQEKVKKTDYVNNYISYIEKANNTSITKYGQNSVINETEKDENGEIKNTVVGYSSAQYDFISRNINIVSNQSVKSPNGETIKTRRIKAYVQLKDENTFVINSSIYEYLPGGECISYYEEGSSFYNGDMAISAEKMEGSILQNEKHMSGQLQSSTDLLSYNGIILSDKGILTLDMIDVSKADTPIKPEILNKIREGLENIQEIIELSDYVDKDTTIEEILADYDRVLDENPHLFYCNSRIFYSYGGKLKPVYIFPRDQIQSIRDTFNYKANSIIKEIIKPGMTDFQKELAIHNFIVKSTRYDEENFLKNSVPPENHTAYGVIITGTAVCDGYAKATKLLSDMIGLECKVINGKVKEGSIWNLHAWNLIKLNGEYYQLDVTWDDPIPDNPETKHFGYFNITDKEIAVNHKWDNESYPACNQKDYNYFYMYNTLVEDYQSFYECILNAVKYHEKAVSIKIVNYNESIYSVSKAMESIWNNDAYQVANCEFSTDKDMGTVRIEFVYR